MPRQPRLDAPGLLQHVMARGIQRCRIFRDEQDYRDFLTRLENMLNATRIHCYAWALLPNHFHLLLRSEDVHLSRAMRGLMTGYAVTFNRRHRRNGHLFQNRYKSVICEDEPYLLELVRYIHLNPLRAGLVGNVSELDGYPWSGHSVLMGHQSNGWQEIEEVLSHFSEKRRQARHDYRSFVEQRMNQEGGSEFEGGGLLRSLNQNDEKGCQVISKGGRIHDERVLGGGEFIEKVFKEAGLAVTAKKPHIPLSELAGKVSEWFKVDLEDLFLGRRKREVSSARALVSYLAINKMGYRFSEVGEALKVHPVTVARSLEKGKEVFNLHQEVLGAFC
jgi:putative transposase